MDLKTSLIWTLFLGALVGCSSDEGPEPNFRNSPIAKFSLENDIPFAGEELIFKNESEGADSYHWDFGDGNNSSVQEPTHIYESEGTYEVQLMATGPGGVDSITMSLDVEIAPFTGDLILRTQQEIDEFGATGFERVKGSVTISDSLSGSITSLAPLSQLQIIEGDLSIGYTKSLTDLAGLGNLVEIHGNLVLRNTAGLTHIQSLTNLSIVGRSVYIFDNNDLLSIDENDLPLLSRIDGDLLIQNNDRLQEINGFLLSLDVQKISISNNEQLQSINAFHKAVVISELNIDTNSSLETLHVLSECTKTELGFFINHNRALTTINGLEKLQEVGGTFEIIDNESLTTLPLFENLTSVWRDLVIGENDQLTSISFPALLQIIFGGVIISSNQSLEEVRGFTKVNRLNATRENSFSSLEITNNPALMGFEDGAFSEIIEVNGNVIISDNDQLQLFPSLSQLENIERDLRVSNNPSMSDFQWLASIRSIGFDMTISDNDSITNLTGLERLLNVRYNLEISQNRQLKDLCALQSLGEPVFEPIIQDNLFNPTLEDIRNGNCSQ